MKRRFYAILFALAAAPLSGCGREPARNPLAPAQDAVSVFPPAPAGVSLAWAPPADGDWNARWIAHLRAGSREGQRFAMEQLRRAGTASGAALGDALRASGTDPAQFGFTLNLLPALGASGARSEWPILAEILRVHPTPVVRTAAAEAAAQLAEPALLPTLLECLDREAEPAPRRAMLTAVARIGGATAAEELEARVRIWLRGSGAGGGGAAVSDPAGDVWNAFMVMDGLELRAALERLDADLPPPLRVQALTARLELGDRTVGPALRGFLDAETYPSAKTRMLALTALADLGDWDAVTGAAADPAPEVPRAVARLLGNAGATDVGLDLLDAWLGSQDVDLRNAALASLVARGQRHRLDPWLLRLRGFPFQDGSTEALLLLTRAELLDPRLTDVLLACWEDAQGDARLDLMRALTRIGAPAAAGRLAQTMADVREEPGVRQVAATLIANFPDCVEALDAWYRAEPSAERASDLVAGLGRWLEQPRAREILLALAADSSAPDAARKVVFDALPTLLGFEACAILQELQAEAGRADVHAYLAQLLIRYF